MANINPHITDPDMRAMMGLAPLTGWVPYYQPGQSDTDSFSGWRNMETGQLSTIDPSSVSNPLFAIGTAQAQGEGATSSPVYADPARSAQYAPYQNYLTQVLQNSAGGMGRIQSDPNFNLGQYFAPAPAGAEFSTLIPQANEGIAKLLQANPGLDTRYGWSPWSDFNDWNQRQNTLFPDEGWGSLLQTIPDAAKDLWAEPGFRQLALTAAGGAMMGGGAPVNAPATAPVSGAASATGAATGTAATPLFSTPASMGTNVFGGTFSTPAMTTFAGPTGTAIGGFSAPATVATSGAGLAGVGALSGGTSSVGGAPVSSGSAVSTAAPWLGEKAIAGLTNPVTLGVLGGAALGGLGGSKQAGTITVEEGLPDWLMPYAKPALDRYSTEIQNYNVDPYGILPNAMEEFQKTISGQYLDPSTNKWLPEYFRLGAERVRGSLSPSFGHMQAFGSHSGYNEALSRGLGDLAVGLYGGAYEKERDRQAQFTANAPGFLAGASTSAFAPYSQYLSTIGSLGRKKDEPFFNNQFGNILGGALVGGSLGKLWG